MKTKYFIIILLVFVLTLLAACGKKEVYVPSPTRPVVRPAPPPKPSLGEQLDHMYRTNPAKWRSSMERLIFTNGMEIPARHLMNAVIEFNDESSRKTCVEATYLYLRKKAHESGRLQEKDERLFSDFMEYALKTPDDHSSNRLKSLCRLIDNEVCQGFK